MNSYFKHSIQGFLFILGVAFLYGFRTDLQGPITLSTGNSAHMERIIVAPDGQGFMAKETKRIFHAWGMNYGNAGRLIEDFWDKEWNTVADDFREMKSLGANVVRVSLQFGKFMISPHQTNSHTLNQLQRLLRLAEKTRLYLDVTGLGCYRPADVPEWYDAMDETERWAAQERFWEAVASACTGNPAVFCYDLINEPLSPTEKRKAGQWRSGILFGDLDFLQYIALDPVGRKPESMAVRWIKRMTTAIRKHDQASLITVGQLPWSSDWKHWSSFLPEKVAPELDFLSVHIYPDSNKPGEALECLRQFSVGKPIVIEETFPLRCSTKELESFLQASRKFACGWMGHYDGAPLDELDLLERAGKLTLPQVVYRDWQRLFVRLKPQFIQAEQK